MKPLLFTAFLLIFVASTVEAWRSDQQAKFKEWKAKFNKSYTSPADEQKAMDKMLTNQDEIDKHNQKFKAGKETFERGLWKRSDLSFDEKKQLLAGAKSLESNSSKLLQAAPSKFKAAPASLNWTDLGLVNAVDDQKMCGSCYAFASVGVVEGVMLRKNSSTRLSVQQIVDCDKVDEGCNGGEPINALKWIKRNGLGSASNYPYTSNEGKCQQNDPLSMLSSVGKTMLYGNEKRLKDFVANYGPVAGKKSWMGLSIQIQLFFFYKVAINAADSLMNYKSGVYNNPKCPKQQDHAVLLVGYGTDPKYGDYWLVKNSWVSLCTRTLMGARI